MIVKSLSRKAQSGSTGQLLGYILRYVLDEKKQLPAEKPFLITHNIRSNTIKGFIKEFEKNEQNRIYKRSDQISIQHTILSWHQADAKYITDAMLKDITNEFIRLRGENNLFIFSKHSDRAHIHLHGAVSATRLDGYSSRMSRQAFSELKLALDAYQKEKYPELVSLPRHGLSKEIGLNNIVSMLGQTGRITQKETLRQALDTLTKFTKTQDELLDGLRSLGHEPYYRAGKLTGIKFHGETKYRLSKLGYDEKKLTDLIALKQKEEQELAELRAIRQHSQDLDKEKEHEQEGEIESRTDEDDKSHNEEAKESDVTETESEESGGWGDTPEDEDE